MKHATQRKRRRNGAEIKAVVERYRQSELSQAEFVHREGISQVTLWRYLKKVGEGVASGVELAGRFIEVEDGGGMLSAGQMRGTPRQPYRVNFGGGANLEIPAGFCIQEVASLLELLSKGGAR
jgi:hypothetical protein